jgi:ATP-dependent DNA helicase RecG
MRGRVGRGAERSYCILIAGAGETERLNVLRRSHDGFEIAREDLRLRGMGDFFGARQHGLPEFRFFDPVRDEDLLELARSAARRVIEQDQELRRPEHAGLAQVLTRRFAARERLYDVG